MERVTNGDKSRALLLVKIAAVLYLLVAVLFNEFIVAIFKSDNILHSLTIQKIRTAQLTFLVLSALLLLITFAGYRLRQIKDFLNRPIMVNLLLLFTIVLVPLSILEVSLRSFMVFTTVYLHDSELGWRMRPDAEDHWEGVVIKTNSLGLRGPEIPYERTNSAFRIMYLGDSIPFGYKLEHYEQSFPFLTETKLKGLIPSLSLETVNAAVAGYSPWQINLFLRREAVRYDPDLIILCFTLNDLTDKFHMMGRGQNGKRPSEGFLPALAGRLARSSGILYYTSVLTNRSRFVLETEAASVERKGYVKRLMEHQADPRVRWAWQMTLDNLSAIYEYCRECDIPLLMIMFPFDFQLVQPPASRMPQSVIFRSAGRFGVPVLDLLPPLRDRMEKDGLEMRNLFMDVSHPTAEGHEVVAEILADYLLNEEFVLVVEDE